MRAYPGCLSMHDSSRGSSDIKAAGKTLLTCYRRGMAAYVGRDVSKLKNKGGKWKYVPPSSPLFSSYCSFDCDMHL